MVRVYHDGTLIASCSVDHVSSMVFSRSIGERRVSLRRYESGHYPVENAKENYEVMTMSSNALLGHLTAPEDRSPNP